MGEVTRVVPSNKAQNEMLPYCNAIANLKFDFFKKWAVVLRRMRHLLYKFPSFVP